MPVLSKTGLLDRFGRRLDERFPEMITLQTYSPQIRDRILELTNRNMVPEMVVGHFGHSDPLVVAEMCEELVQLTENCDYPIRRFVTTLASSVPGGQQSSLMSVLYGHAQAYAANRHVELVPVTRTVDVSRYKMASSVSEKKPLLATLAEDGEGVGAIIMAGGSVQPGRKLTGGAKGKINGLLDIGKIDHITAMNRILHVSGRKDGREPYILPVGVDKTHRFFSPDYLLPTPEGIASVYDLAGKVLRLFGVRMLSMDVRIGMPITSEQMQQELGTGWRKRPAEVNSIVMREIARLVPRTSRGYLAGEITEELPQDQRFYF